MKHLKNFIPAFALVLIAASIVSFKAIPHNQKFDHILTGCATEYYFLFTGTPGQDEHNPSAYIYEGTSFTVNCPGALHLCLIVVCAKWVVFDPVTGDPTSIIVGASNDLDTAIDTAIASHSEGSSATDGTYEIFLKS
jgi:hypothetical protein